MSKKTAFVLVIILMLAVIFVLLYTKASAESLSPTYKGRQLIIHNHAGEDIILSMHSMGHDWGAGIFRQIWYGEYHYYWQIPGGIWLNNAHTQFLPQDTTVTYEVHKDYYRVYLTYQEELDNPFAKCEGKYGITLTINDLPSIKVKTNPTIITIKPCPHWRYFYPSGMSAEDFKPPTPTLHPMFLPLWTETPTPAPTPAIGTTAWHWSLIRWVTDKGLLNTGW